MKCAGWFKRPANGPRNVEDSLAMLQRLGRPRLSHPRARLKGEVQDLDVLV
jgi:hypothetical protein